MEYCLMVLKIYMHWLRLLLYGNDDDNVHQNMQGTLVEEELTHWLLGNFNDILGT